MYSVCVCACVCMCVCMRVYVCIDLNLAFIMACIIFPYEGATSLLWNNKRLCAGVFTHCSVCQLSQPQKTMPPSHPIIEKDFLDRVQVDLIDMKHSPDNECNYIDHFMHHFSKFHVLFH